MIRQRGQFSISNLNGIKTSRLYNIVTSSNHNYINLFSNPYHMSLFKRNFQNIAKWDVKDDVRT
jgi:hypothetical protein